jgi:hypothetical protein
VQRLAELVDQSGALRNERDLVAAHQAQLFDQRILRHERSPALPVEAQGVGQTPGVELVVFHAAGALRSR